MNSSYNKNITDLVDDIKSVCTHSWLWGDANEYKIVTQAFLYKFLNDKFLHEVKKIYPNAEGYDDLKDIDDITSYHISSKIKTLMILQRYLMRLSTILLYSITMYFQYIQLEIQI